MKPTLPDVNVLIALLDPLHVHHERAHAWFAEARRNDAQLATFDRRMLTGAVKGGDKARSLIP